ncbi:MAG: hypothetical protein GF308_21210 [Candidatus Heimdallarchaeota archaeon]|nr:hypothetical protein [Candidatus Heimdallarchaeota archaeon]
MHFLLVALIVGVIFAALAALAVWVGRGETSLAIAIVSGAGFLAGFLISLVEFWYGTPVLTTIIIVSLLLGGIGVIVLLRIFSQHFRRLGRAPAKLAVIVLGVGMILVPAFFGINSAIYKGFDQAKYFDSVLEFPESTMPFTNVVSGDHLRVVDSDLAAEIIQKSSPFGSNTEILDLHIGKINGKLMWVASIGTDAIRMGTDNEGRKRNTIFGFVGVDLNNPSAEVVVVEQTFTIGRYLARSKQLDRIVWKINPNYRFGGNEYFSMNDEGEMRLLVPYSISESFRIRNEWKIGMTTYLEKMGGVLEFDSEGNLVKNYVDLTQLPHYARIQCYSEEWLELSINKWGRHRKGDHEFAYWFTTSEQLGIAWYDDIRVIYDANTGETSQYVMLTQPESESQLLRGAIKANMSGIYFFDWSEISPKPIDTYNAIENSLSKINEEKTTAHEYEPILPLLYPIQQKYNNLTDFAYVVPLQYQGIRFGGIAITNPFIPGGEQTIVEYREGGETTAEVLPRALNNYLLMLGEGGEEEYIETFLVTDIASFEEEGNTVFVAKGNLTYIPEGEELETTVPNTTVWFLQQYLNGTQWVTVLFMKPGDTLKLNVVLINDIFYCLEIVSIN